MKVIYLKGFSGETGCRGPCSPCSPRHSFLYRTLSVGGRGDTTDSVGPWVLLGVGGSDEEVSGLVGPRAMGMDKRASA